MKKFIVGRTYATRSIGDHDTIYSFLIHSRTSSCVWVTVHDETVRRGVKVFDGVETFKPFGTYSMCAVIRADKESA